MILWAEWHLILTLWDGEVNFLFPLMPKLQLFTTALKSKKNILQENYCLSGQKQTLAQAKSGYIVMNMTRTSDVQPNTFQELTLRKMWLIRCLSRRCNTVHLVSLRHTWNLMCLMILSILSPQSLPMIRSGISIMHYRRCMKMLLQYNTLLLLTRSNLCQKVIFAIYVLQQKFLILYKIQ